MCMAGDISPTTLSNVNPKLHLNRTAFLRFRVQHNTAHPTLPRPPLIHPQPWQHPPAKRRFQIPSRGSAPQARDQPSVRMLAAAVRALALLALFSTLSLASAARADGAFLILSRVISGDLVAATNFTVSYSVYNVGGADATSVALRDTAFPASRFKVHAGSFRKTWGRVNAGESVVLDVVAEPKREGELLVNPAALSYKDGDVKRTTRLAGAESMVVEDLLTYRRRTDTHEKAWMGYGLACVAAIGLPYVMSARGIASLEKGKKKA